MGEDRFHDNQTRQTLARAGHAHIGVLIILSVICQILVDFIDHTQALSWFIRIGLLRAARRRNSTGVLGGLPSSIDLGLRSS